MTSVYVNLINWACSHRSRWFYCTAN